MMDLGVVLAIAYGAFCGLFIGVIIGSCCGRRRKDTVETPEDWGAR